MRWKIIKYCGGNYCISEEKLREESGLVEYGIWNGNKKCAKEVVSLVWKLKTISIERIRRSGDKQEGDYFKSIVAI